MTLEEIQAHMDDREKKYGEPDSDEFESENLQKNDSEPTEHEVFDCETYDPRERHGSTGPRTPEGKAISSQNANKHGCRSKTLVLRHEDPAEYEALYKKWLDHYQPDGHAEETLVKQLIDSHWFFLRASKRLEQVDWEMPTNAYHWTDTHQKLMNNFMRYKTTAERAYQKSFRIVEGYFRDCLRDKIAVEKADLMRLKIEAQIARKAAPSKPPESTKTQDCNDLQSPKVDLPSNNRQGAQRRQSRPTRVQVITVIDPNEHGLDESCAVENCPTSPTSPISPE